MREERAQEIRAAYHDRFLPARDESWLRAYLAAVQTASAAPEAVFRTRDFQRDLWEADGVTGVGPGKSVVVTGAYDDPDVVDALWALRNRRGAEDVLERARSLEAEFERILDIVTPRHNWRKPWARLARIFAILAPRDVLCLLGGPRIRQFRQWLEQPSYKLDFIGQHVILRQALREVLGPERSVEDEVLYSQFSWYAWDNILKPADPEAVAAASSDGGRATDTPPLSILPAALQRKGLNFLTNNLGLLLSLVRAAENGIDRETLDQQITEEAPSLSRGTRSNLLSQASGLGLLSVENGTYRPTSAGRALLEGEPPSEVLTPIMVRNVFGIAQILDDLGRNGAMNKADIIRSCQIYYPRWTSSYAPDQLIAWLKLLDLVSLEGVGAHAIVRLTDAGEYWRSGLPEDIKIPSLLLTDARPDEPADEAAAPSSPASPVASLQAVSVQSIIDRFRNNDQLRSLVFSDDQITLIHAALHSAAGKRFVLLAGLSGTGKTSMAQGYARAYCEALGLSLHGHYEQVAVWPDWTDPTGLLGYVNPLANPPVFQETRALRLLLTAGENPGKPYFLCLDEMNLARVEHYFAPFLSAMEGRDGRLAVHASRDPIDGIPPSIPWPANLFIMGTVNMDETTYPFSDKVLDRAFTFEFWDVDLEGWKAAAIARGASEGALDRVFPVLEAMSAALKPARRHFGYRTCDEVLGFVSASPDEVAVAALDAAVLAKVLPKVRGDNGGPLPEAIAKAAEISALHGLERTADKLTQMSAALKEVGAVRFWS